MRGSLAFVKDSTWVVCTPDFDLEAVDLSTHPIRAVRRNAPYPRDVGRIYGFDNPPDAASLAAARVEAQLLAVVLGGPAVPAAGAYPAMERRHGRRRGKSPSAITGWARGRHIKQRTKIYKDD